LGARHPFVVIAAANPAIGQLCMVEAVWLAD
jgi:hypothetical protein